MEDKKPKVPHLPPKIQIPGSAPKLPMTSRPSAPGAPAMKAPPRMPGGLPSGRASVERPTTYDGVSAAAVSDLQKQIIDLQANLQQEREKLLLQAMKSKEEESMATKVEDSIRDIQERIRREKRDQETEEMRRKLETKISELEGRLAQERETWVQTLKSQMLQRDDNESEIDEQFTLKLRDLERRWHEEKLSLSSVLKSKEDENARLKSEFEKNIFTQKDDYEKRLSQIETERDAILRDLREISSKAQEERSALNKQIEERDREFLSVKAQVSMSSVQLREEKQRSEKLTQIIERLNREKAEAVRGSENKEKEFFLLKTQFALYQGKMKNEQDKLLKEILFHKERFEKGIRDFELLVKTREDEIRALRAAWTDKEKDIKNALERKEAELVAARSSQEERIKTFQAEFERKLADKDAAAKTAEATLSARLKEVELSGQEKISLIERDAERRVSVVEKDALSAKEKVRELENALARSGHESDIAARNLAQSRAEVASVLMARDAIAAELAGLRAELERSKSVVADIRRENESLVRDAENRLKEAAASFAVEKADILRANDAALSSVKHAAAADIGLLKEKHAETERAFAERYAAIERSSSEKLAASVRDHEDKLRAAQALAAEKLSMVERAASERYSALERSSSEKVAEAQRASSEKLSSVTRDYEEKFSSLREELASERLESGEHAAGIAARETELKSKEAALNALRVENVRLQEDAKTSSAREADLERDIAEREARMRAFESERRLVEFEIRRSAEVAGKADIERVHKEADDARRHYEQMMTRWYEERDRMRTEIMTRDAEIEKVKIDYSRKEMDIRADVEAKYRSLIESLKKENSTLDNTLNDEIGEIKEETNRSLKAVREELADKEKESAANLAAAVERENKIRELEKNLAAMNADSRARFERLDEEKVSLEREIKSLRESAALDGRRIDPPAAFSPETAEMKRTLDEIAARYRILENDAALKDAEIASFKKLISEHMAARVNSAPVVIGDENPPTARPAPASQPETVPSAPPCGNISLMESSRDGDRPVRRDESAIKSFWDDLNKPVIEIGKKSRRDMRPH
ncbi:MAG: hypothetical protein QME32_00610 [Endomicrobiia bacterium]|nr:hypothetical protein [Endomicrobiia bacterium]